MVIVADEYFRRAVLSCLNVFGVVFMSEASVAHVNYFEEEFIVELNFNAFPK